MRCNFEILCSYVDNELNETLRYEVLAHLHQCDICMEAVGLMCSDRDADHLESDSPKRRADLVETVDEVAFVGPSVLRSSVRHGSQRNYRTVPPARLSPPTRGLRARQFF